MFTTGRIIFTAIFIAAFAAYLIWAYTKDARLQKKYFKGAGVILGILVVIWLVFFGFVKLM